MTRFDKIKQMNLEEFVSYIYGHKQFRLGYKNLKKWLMEDVEE